MTEEKKKLTIAKTCSYEKLTKKYTKVVPVLMNKTIMQNLEEPRLF